MSNQIGSLKMGQKLKKTPAGEIPVDWGVATIADLCQVNPEVIKESTPPDTRLKYIDIASIERTGCISIPKDMEFKDAPSRARRIVKAGDVIVSTVRPYLKAFARVTDLSENLIASTGFAVLRARPNVNGGYVYQHVLSDSFVKYLEEKMTGSSYPAVNSSDVAAYQMPVPTAREQENIGRILSDVDNLIDKVDAEIKKTKELKKGLMRQLLTRGIGHKKFKKTKIGEIPADWKVCKVLEVCSIGPSKTEVAEPADIDVSFLRMGCVKEDGGGIAEMETKKLKDIGNGYTYFREGDVLFAKITPCMENGKIAIARNLKNSIGFGSTEFHVLRANPQKMLPQYLFSWISRKEFRESAARYFRGSAGQQRVQRGFFEEADITVPTLKEQEKISSMALGMDAEIVNKQDLLASYVGLKKSLMSVLLTGKVRV